MDLASLFGILIAYSMLLGSIILSGNPMALYWDTGSMILVVIGSLGSLMMASDMSTLKNIPKYIGLVFKAKEYNSTEIITQLVGFAESARKDGLLSLDDAIKDVEDKFLSDGLRLVVDGTDPLIITKILELEMEKMDDRHSKGAGFFDTWAALAPAYGMLGTVIGLIGMMANLGDSAGIGSAMALALITTFYGSLVANSIALPIAMKLRLNHDKEMLQKEIMLEGILSIQSGDNPRILEQKLYSFLPVPNRPVSQEVQ
ncbi:motility protein A [Entomospira nematocerorum]|uniref:Motility protein A n=1 Tax=Entomospira nematocerorum TaxID=2719987 RepID=A0A968GDH0_9SPIO|nr:motility protein A [Entomospira nematocera]NIZ47453.1 motility protein A [Entomospira nematocera]WDI34008.1 motility protein A [Entomospira nematocera]